MAYIRYPYHVKHGGADYPPGALIQVDDAAEYVAQGAEEAACGPPQPPKPRRRRRADAPQAGPEPGKED